MQRLYLMLCGLLILGCEDARPELQGILANRADGIATTHPDLDCGAQDWNIPGGKLKGCAGRALDSTMIFYYDSSNTVVAVGTRLNTSDATTASVFATRRDSLINRYGAGLVCEERNAITARKIYEHRWQTDSGQVVLSALESATQQSGGWWVQEARQTGPLECGRSFSPPVGI